MPPSADVGAWKHSHINNFVEKLNGINCSEKGQILQWPVLFVENRAHCKILEMMPRHLNGADTSWTFKNPRVSGQE